MTAGRERQQQIEARPPKHGDVWIHKQTGEGRAVLMVCGHDDEDATVSGLSLRPGRPPFALPLATFLARHILLAVDPDLEHEHLAERLSGLQDTLAEALADLRYGDAASAQLRLADALKHDGPPKLPEPIMRGTERRFGEPIDAAFALNTDGPERYHRGTTTVPPNPNADGEAAER